MNFPNIDYKHWLSVWNEKIGIEESYTNTNIRPLQGKIG